MPALKIEDFASKNFAVELVDGRFYILKKCNETTSFDALAVDEYKTLKRTWRKSVKQFDTLCDAYKFEQLI
jgi:hypothetical protein